MKFSCSSCINLGIQVEMQVLESACVSTEITYDLAFQITGELVTRQFKVSGNLKIKLLQSRYAIRSIRLFRFSHVP